MPHIITEDIPNIPPKWAQQHPTIQVTIEPHPYEWTLEAWTQGRRILTAEEGEEATYSMQVPPQVTKAIYQWLDSIHPIYNSNWFAANHTVEWQDRETDDFVIATKRTPGCVQVDLYREDEYDSDCLATAYINHDGTTQLPDDDNYREHMERLCSTAHKYFFPNCNERTPQ